MKYNTEELNHLMRHRRSVFPAQFSGERVPKEVVEQMLENANWAPTHGLTEPWRFFVIAGDALPTFANMQAEMYKALTPAESFKEGTYQKLQTNPLTASHIICVAMKRQPEERIPELEEIEAVACAVQNMYLTATAYGYGGYWASGGVTYREELKEHFGLGAKDRILGFFYLGVPSKPVPDGKRGPVSEKTVWI
jgi:nitroreductase